MEIIGFGTGAEGDAAIETTDSVEDIDGDVRLDV
jgi:hypothetical protein